MGKLIARTFVGVTSVVGVAALALWGTSFFQASASIVDLTLQIGADGCVTEVGSAEEIDALKCGFGTKPDAVCLNQGDKIRWKVGSSANKDKLGLYSVAFDLPTPPPLTRDYGRWVTQTYYCNGMSRERPGEGSAKQKQLTCGVSLGPKAGYVRRGAKEDFEHEEKTYFVYQYYLRSERAVVNDVLPDCNILNPHIVIKD